MFRQYVANVNNEEELGRVFWTAIETSKNDTVYVMSNGAFVQLAHRDYMEEMKEEGYWTACIFEHGHRVEA